MDVVIQNIDLDAAFGWLEVLEAEEDTPAENGPCENSILHHANSSTVI